MLETAPEIAVLRAALAAAEARASAAEEELTQTRAVVLASEDMIRHLRLQIAKLRREQYGHSAERHARLIEQLEMQLEDIETDIAIDRARTEDMVPKTAVTAFERRRSGRKPFPDHLPRERVVIEAPAACTCCGSARIVKMGEDITETLEVIPRQWKVVQTVRRKEHPTRHLAGWTGILQADAYGGYNDLYSAQHKPAPVLRALCWSHARRKFFELADIKATARKGRSVVEEISPIALEAVRRFDAIFDVEREITGMTAEARHDARQRLVRPMVSDLHDWLRAERARMSKHNPVAKAITYMFEEDGRWDAFTRFLDDSRICLTNNAAERALRGIALGRKAWLFAGSPRGGDRAAFLYSLIVTAKMNDVDPQAWLADVLGRLPDMPLSRLPELLPWHWKAQNMAQAA